MIDFTTPAGIAATAIALANILVWSFGPAWTPRQKAGIGALTATAVFILGLILWPAAFPDGPAAFTTLFYALLTVLAAAGAPVYRDILRTDPDPITPLAARRRGRRWTAWNK